jgi:hypothetical protein
MGKGGMPEKVSHRYLRTAADCIPMFLNATLDSKSDFSCDLKAICARYGVGFPNRICWNVAKKITKICSIDAQRSCDSENVLVEARDGLCRRQPAPGRWGHLQDIKNAKIEYRG